jgi:hypothetical protein
MDTDRRIAPTTTEPQPAPSGAQNPLTCRHINLTLEKGRLDYLTGWYVCCDCGERLLAR